VSAAPTPPPNRPDAASNPAAQSAAPFPAATDDEPEAPADADAAPTPPGNSAAKLADAEPPATPPAAPVFSMHTCTNTSTDNDTSTAVNVPNPGSNASNATVPALSKLTVALALSETVAADPTPEGASIARMATEAAVTTRHPARLQFCVTRPITLLQPPLAVDAAKRVTFAAARESPAFDHGRQKFSRAPRVVPKQRSDDRQEFSKRSTAATVTLSR
jgi:hypothetical protein